MSTDDDLPGRWVDLQLIAAIGGAGVGPALVWVAGALASGGRLWAWPHLGTFLLGLFLTTAVWGRLWARFAPEADPLPGTLPPPPPPADPRLVLPYTEPGSLSATWEVALRQAWWRLRQAVARHHGGLLEALVLGGVLLVVTALWGWYPLLTALAGLALLCLRRLVCGRPAALSLLRVLGGLAWPWWLGHVVWAPLTGDSLLLSMLWGLAYAGWAEATMPRAAGRPLLWSDLAQGGVVAFFLLSGRPVVGGVVTLALLPQVLLQAGLGRAGRRREIAGRTWPWAALGMVLTGLALGGWV